LIEHSYELLNTEEHEPQECVNTESKDRPEPLPKLKKLELAIIKLRNGNVLGTDFIQVEY
jgi:hypothetical protein